MLSDERVEFTESLQRLAADEVASEMAAAELGLSRRCLDNEPGTATDDDAD